MAVMHTQGAANAHAQLQLGMMHATQASQAHLALMAHQGTLASNQVAAGMAAQTQASSTALAAITASATTANSATASTANAAIAALGVTATMGAAAMGTGVKDQMSKMHGLNHELELPYGSWKGTVKGELPDGEGALIFKPSHRPFDTPTGPREPVYGGTYKGEVAIGAFSEHGTFYFAQDSAGGYRRYTGQVRTP